MMTTALLRDVLSEATLAKHGAMFELDVPRGVTGT